MARSRQAFAGTFRIFADELRLEQSLSFLSFQSTKISASKDTSGLLSIAAVEMRAPFLQKRFAHVRGVTRWQDDRLSVGSINLLEGLAIDSLVIDLTALRAGRVGTDLAVPVLGGKMRANIATNGPTKYDSGKWPAPPQEFPFPSSPRPSA